MARIRLAHWYRGHVPGDEIDVADDEVKALERDGRVAAVIAAPEPGKAPAEPVTEPYADSAEPRRGRKGGG
ncbi:hypothetical protein JJV70_02015 [Streptomyces sp. JJ66]|uniref:hypothetical protein n=1 Tax=Streptomyces sp. JJ66 TaxID=2803843 RepID=UPI001C56F864|nr:hypothetical protein [Streptomyces sp. JJ66]MBW1600896.1 hypothetical protein [Streptomyces sp. JJ66]